MKRHLTTLLVLGLVLLAATAFAGAAAKGGGRNLDLSLDYQPEGDGPVFMAADATGTMWAVWSYRNGVEYDVAVCRRIGRTWSAPVLLGVANRRDDLDPRIAFPGGVPVVFWWQGQSDGSTDQIVMTHLSGKNWSSPQVLGAGDLNASHPNVFTATTNTVTIGFVTPGGNIGTGQIEVAPKPVNPNGVTNGPDPIPTVTINDPARQQAH